VSVRVHDVLILVREAHVSPPPPLPLLSYDVLRHSDAIAATLSALGHHLAPARLDRRLANDLSFLRFDLEGQAIASTWVAGPGGRYIDELSWLMPIGADEFWLRDVFVAPKHRGQRLLSHISAAVATLAGHGSRRVWSDVDRVNRQSVRAHESAGFKALARVRAVDFGGWLRIRSSLPDWPLPVEEIDPASRCIWLGGRARARHEELIA
jgi:GNAT superfamily N-acetyltransferase